MRENGYKNNLELEIKYVAWKQINRYIDIFLKITKSMKNFVSVFLWNLIHFDGCVRLNSQVLNLVWYIRQFIEKKQNTSMPLTRVLLFIKSCQKNLKLYF